MQPLLIILAVAWVLPVIAFFDPQADEFALFLPVIVSGLVGAICAVNLWMIWALTRRGYVVPAEVDGSATHDLGRGQITTTHVTYKFRGVGYAHDFWTIRQYRTGETVEVLVSPEDPGTIVKLLGQPKTDRSSA